jgi:hypothetical protein
MLDLIDPRLTPATGYILNRPAYTPRLGSKPYRLCGSLGVIPISILEISTNRQIGRTCKIAQMLDHLVSLDLAIPSSSRKGITRTRRSDRLKTNKLQEPRSSRIPWIWNDECSRSFVKFAKYIAFF